jgi:hypothetical protein
METCYGSRWKTPLALSPITTAAEPAAPPETRIPCPVMDNHLMSQPRKQSQSRLAYDRRQRFQALRGIDRTKLDKPIGAHTWSNVIDLLVAVDLCTGQDGCFSYAETIASKMNQGLGVSRAKFWRICGLAKSLELLDTEARYNRQGQQSNEWCVFWDKIMVLGARAVTESPETPPPKPAAAKTVVKMERVSESLKNEVLETLNLRPPRLNLSHYNKGLVVPLVVPLRSTVDRGDESPDDHGDDSEEIQDGTPIVEHHVDRDWDPIRGEANRVFRKLGPPRCELDRSLALKAIILGRTVLSEAAVTDAVEAVVQIKPANRWGYFHTCLSEKCQLAGLNLNRELARIRVPPEILRGRSPPLDLSERLCK